MTLGFVLLDVTYNFPKFCNLSTSLDSDITLLLFALGLYDNIYIRFRYKYGFIGHL